MAWCLCTRENRSMVAAMGKVSRKWNPYAAIGVGGLRRGHRLWGIVGRLGSWLGREVGRERPQRELRRLALDGDGKRDGPQLGLKGDVGVGRLGPRLGLDRRLIRQGPKRGHGRLDRRGIEERLETRRELDLILGLVRRDGKQ